MLIINADDLGKNGLTTDRIIDCYKRGLITSASAMVFMKDSQRAAEAAILANLNTGFHLNLTLLFDAPSLPSRLLENHGSVVGYFRRGTWTQVLYNPFLRKKLEYTFNAQYEEYLRLFSREPAQIDGHHHMHLCLNMIFSHLFRRGQRIRRHFTFGPAEKDIFNRAYRRLVDAWLISHYCCTDSFYSMEPVDNRERIEQIVRLAYTSNVEIMMHPERAETYTYLLSEHYRALIREVPKGSYNNLSSER